MEIEKERNIHYLHPDFEEDNENKEKKPSPLALLAQTCQSIGFGKESKNILIRDKSCSPNSTSTGTRRSIKRSNSDYLSNSSNSPIVERVISPPIKKTKQTCDIDHKCSTVELNRADTSSENGREINQSLMNSFMNFLKNSDNSQQSYTDKLEFLYFLTNKFMNPETNIVNEKPKDISHFNISNGYHLKNNVYETINQLEEPIKASPINSNNIQSINNNDFNNYDKLMEPNQKSAATIKYCMYCGKLIPLLPMLLAHIRMDHTNDQYNDLRIQNPMPSLCDFLTKFNPYILANPIKSNQSSPVPSLTNYINNWSSLLGYENLIF